MLYKMIETIENKDMLKAGETVLAGVSGGADSICLLLLLRECCERIGAKLCAVHVHHGIRGAEADRDAAFTEKLCRDLQVPFLLKTCDVPAYVREKGGSEEEAARILRYDCLAEAAGEMGAVRIAVAHNQNDQAETLLFRLIRGSSIRGLRGMEPVTGVPGHPELGERTLIRPLLDISRQEIEDYLRIRGQSWCTDSTNEEEDYTRNKLRKRLLPEAEEIHPGSLRHMAEAAGQLGEIYDWIRCQSEAFLREQAREGENEVLLPVTSLTELPPFLAVEVIRTAIERLGAGLKDLTALHGREIRGLLEKQSGKKLDLPGDVYAERRFEWLVLGRKSRKEGEGETGGFCLTIPDPEDWPQEGITLETGEWRFHLRRQTCEPEVKIPRMTYTKWFDYDKIKSGLCIRSRRTGDWLQPYKEGGKKSLKSYLIQEKIPASGRDEIPLLAMEDHILWVLGGRISEAFRVTRDTRRLLIVRAEKKDNGKRGHNNE